MILGLFLHSCPAFLMVRLAGALFRNLFESYAAASADLPAALLHDQSLTQRRTRCFNALPGRGHPLLTYHALPCSLSRYGDET
jgi:hypothetical protein